MLCAGCGETEVHGRVSCFEISWWCRCRSKLDLGAQAWEPVIRAVTPFWCVSVESAGGRPDGFVGVSLDLGGGAGAGFGGTRLFPACLTS